MWKEKTFGSDSLDMWQVQLYVNSVLFLNNELDLQTLGIKVFYSRTQPIFACLLPQWMIKIEKKTFIQKYGALRMSLS